MEYFLKYVRRVPAQILPGDLRSELPGNILGDIVHAVIREKLDSPQRAIDDIVKRIAISRELPMALLPMEEIRQLSQRAIAYHAERQWQQYRTEQPFSLRIGAAIVHGTVDFLGKDGKGWHITDYKTDRLAAKSELTARAKSYDLQMLAYAGAATLAGLTPLISTTLLFLRLHAPVTAAVAEGVDVHARRTLQGVIGQIEAKNWEVGRSPPCRSCPYHHNGMCWEDRLRKTQPA